MVGEVPEGAGTGCGSVKALCFCVGQEEGGASTTVLALQRHLLLHSGSLSHRQFCGANPEFLRPFANESSVVFKLKQVGEVSLAKLQWKMWRARMFGFVWMQSNKIYHMDVGNKIVCNYHLSRKSVILLFVFSFPSLLA